MPKKYKTDALAALHESMSDLHDLGIIPAKTMRGFDATCLTDVKDITPKKIAEIRGKTGASQAVFARYMAVTTGTVSKWESGKKKPTGPALKLIQLVKKKGLEAIA